MVIRGEILTRQGKSSDAVPILLEAAVKAAPDNAEAHYHLGVAYAGVSIFGLAQTEVRPGCPPPPDMMNPTRHCCACRSTGRHIVAGRQRFPADLMKLEPKAAEATSIIRASFVRKVIRRTRKPILNKAIATAPQDASVFARMGDLHMSEKEFDEAAKYIRRRSLSIRRPPTRSPAWSSELVAQAAGTSSPSYSGSNRSSSGQQRYVPSPWPSRAAQFRPRQG